MSNGILPSSSFIIIVEYGRFVDHIDFIVINPLLDFLLIIFIFLFKGYIALMSHFSPLFFTLNYPTAPVSRRKKYSLLIPLLIPQIVAKSDISDSRICISNYPYFQIAIRVRCKLYRFKRIVYTI